MLFSCVHFSRFLAVSAVILDACLKKEKYKRVKVNREKSLKEKAGKRILLLSSVFVASIINWFVIAVCPVVEFDETLKRVQGELRAAEVAARSQPSSGDNKGG